MLSLRELGILDTGTLRALETVPRAYFARRRFADLARADVALPLPFGQTMTSPSTVALMIAALAVRPGQRILEIGTGTGYVAALLARMGGQVRSLERVPALAEGAARRLHGLGLSLGVEIGCRDGLSEGIGGAGRGGSDRTDRILVNGVLPRALPPALTARLVAGGRLVAGLATEAGPRLLVVTREADGTLARTLGGPLRLARLVGDDVAFSSARNPSLT